MTKDPWHGTTGGYTNHRCRCDPCSAAWKAYHVAWRTAAHKRLADGAVARRHGDAGTYRNWGCRCLPCREVVAAERRLM